MHAYPPRGGAGKPVKPVTVPIKPITLPHSGMVLNRQLGPAKKDHP